MLRKNSMRANTWFALAIAVGLVGCGETVDDLEEVDVAPEVVEVPRPELVDDAFPVADVEVREGVLPERFLGELPGSVEEFERTWSQYPAVHLHKQLCRADASSLERFERAVRAAAGATPEAISETYGLLLENCGRPELCTWARDAVQDGDAVADLAWRALAQCNDDSLADVFASSAAPSEAVVDYWTLRAWGGDYVPRWIPELGDALGEVARSGDVYRTRQAAMVLSQSGMAAAEPLLTLHDALPEGPERDEILASLGDVPHPRAQQLFEQYCSRQQQSDAICSSSWQVQGLEEPEAPPSSCLEDPELQEQLVDDDLMAAYETGECLAALAVAERSKAVAEARQLKGWAIADPALAELVATLDAFPEEGALEAQLKASGLLPRGPLPGWEPAGDALTAGEILEDRGPVRCFDAETGQFPNEHDSLLADLAELAGAPLAEAVFEEIPPAYEVLTEGFEERSAFVASGEPYQLRAYLNGRIYETAAQDFGDWYDVEQVLGLLNAVAVGEEASARVVALPTEDQTVCVLAAPRDAILEGMRQGWVKPVSGNRAMELGKAFEAEMLENLFQQDAAEFADTSSAD